ncbi:sensor histidine kinase [Spirosoma fluminis]
MPASLSPNSVLPVAATAVLDKLPDGVVYYEAVRNAAGGITDFRLMYYNPLFRQLTSIAHQLQIGEQVLRDFPQQKDVWEPIVRRYATVVESGQAMEYLETEASQGRSVSIRVAPYDHGVIATLRDVTSQQRWVKEEQQRFEDVLNASLSNTFVYEAIRDADGQIQDFHIRFANQAARQAVLDSWGLEAIGNTILTVYPGSPESGQFRHCVQVIETGQPVRLELYYPAVEIWYDTSITKLGDGCIVTGLDITDRKRNELQAEQQTADQERIVNELRQSNENLRQFAQVASHDLQEPLRRIQAFSDILQSQFEDNLSDGERDMTRRIQKSAKRMQMLIKDLLMYSQLATERAPLKPVSLHNVLEDVVSDLEIAIAEQKATVTVGKLPTILGSSSRLHQLFQNLIANALKFQQPHQQATVDIEARLALPEELPAELQGQSAAFWLVTVADNGLGFDEKYKGRIFHPFQRLHDASLYSGTGIGLAICQRVAENHGGAIDVNSQPGKGTTFKIFLPLYQKGS